MARIGRGSPVRPKYFKKYGYTSVSLSGPVDDTAPAVETDILKDSFETDTAGMPTDWESVTTSGSTITTTKVADAVDGTYSIRLTNPSGTDPGIVTTAFYPASAGARISGAISLKHTVVGSSLHVLKVLCFDAAEVSTGSVSITNVDTPAFPRVLGIWHRRGGTTSALPAGTTKVKFQISGGQGATQDVQIDALRIRFGTVSSLAYDGSDVQATVARARAAADSAPAVDAVTGSLSLPRAAADTAPAVDTLTGTTSQARAAADSAPAVDTLARTLTLARAAVETYNVSNFSLSQLTSTSSMGALAVNTKLAMAFTLAAPTAISQVTLPVVHTGVSDDVTVDIAAALLDVSPVGGLTSTIAGSTLPTAVTVDGDLTTFTFPAPAVLPAGTYYVRFSRSGANDAVLFYGWYAIAGSNTWRYNSSTLAWTNIAADVLARIGSVTADAASRSVSQSRAADDSAPATDTVDAEVEAGGTSAPVSDSAPAVDTLARSLVMARAPPDSAPAVDTVTRALVLTRAAADDAAATDAITRALSQARVAADSAPATDAVTRTGPTPQDRAVSDSAPATDAVTRTLSQSRAAADSAPATDAVTRTFTLSRACADSAPATDAVSRTLALARAVVDSAPATDTCATSFTQPRACTDSAPAIDAITRTLSQSRATADSVPAPDAVTSTLTQPRACADSAPATDTTTRTQSAQHRNVADDAAATDTVVAVYTPVGSTDRFVSDDARSIDTVSANRILSRNVGDSAPATDGGARTLSQARTTTDSVPATDAVVCALTSPRSVVDSAPAVDTVTRTLALTRAVADLAAAVDAITRTVVQARAVIDDAPAIDTAPAGDRSIADSAPAQDATESNLTLSRSVADSAPAVDVYIPTYPRVESPLVSITQTFAGVAVNNPRTVRVEQAFTARVNVENASRVVDEVPARTVVLGED